jgi:hypothetical protein
MLKKEMRGYEMMPFRVVEVDATILGETPSK